MLNVDSVFSSLSYIPILIFFLILMLGFIIGFINTTKPALFFLIWNLIFIGLYYVISKYFNEFAKSALNQMNVNVAKYDSFYPFFFLFYLFIYNSFVFNLYFLFRKGLKESVIEKKEIEESILFHRIIGGFLWIIIALPLSIVITEISTTFFGSSSFTENFTSKLLYYLTLKDLSSIPTKEVQEYINYWKEFSL